MNEIAKPQTSRSDDIEEAALSLFVERGYHGTTMKDIAERVGIRAPSLYNHIGSKQQILRTIMLTTEKRLLTEFREVLGKSNDVVSTLRDAVRVFVEYHAYHRREALIGNRETASLEEPARSGLIQLRRDHERGIRALIETGCTEGCFTVKHPHLASFAILEMGVSVARWFRMDGVMTPEQVAESYGDLAVNMCRTARWIPEPAEPPD